jgi:glutathione S-transferase
VPYEIQYYERDKDFRAKDLLKAHPLGKSPIITDGDITLAESGAIIRAYLQVCLSTVHSTDTVHRARVRHQ